MTRENKIQMRMALNECIKDEYELLADFLSFTTILLSERGLEEDEIKAKILDLKDGASKFITQFYIN